MLPARPQRACHGTSASQYVPPAAQRRSGDGPFAPPPTHRANLAVGEAFHGAAAVRMHPSRELLHSAKLPTVIVPDGRELGWPREGSERRISGAGVSHDPEASPITGTPGLSAEPSVGRKRSAVRHRSRVDAAQCAELPAAGRRSSRAVADPGPAGGRTGRAGLALGGFTDWLDGYLARAWHQTSRIGQMLDPIADRLYILAVLVGLALREIVPWWLAVIMRGTRCLRRGVSPSSQDERLLVPARALPGQGRHLLPAVRFPLVLLGSGAGGLASAGLGPGLGIRHLGHGSVLVRRRPLPGLQTLRLLRSTPPIHGHSRSSVTR